MGHGDGPARAHTLPQHLAKQTLGRCGGGALMCRFCCKSLFALVIKISFGCTRDFRANNYVGDLIA